MPPAFEAIIFDLDGVIIDSEPIHEEAQRVVFAKYNISVPPSAFASFKGKTELAVFEYVLDNYATEKLDLKEVVDFKHRVYQELMARKLKPIVGAIDFLDQLLTTDIKLGLTTSAIRANQERAFAMFDLQRYFPVVITSEDVEKPKPDPEPYSRTASLVGVETKSCLVIEDTIPGVQSALSAGCHVAGLSTTTPKEDLVAAGVDVAVDSYEELSRWLTMD